MQRIRKKALPGTIRADFADSIDHNAVHGSDSDETAKNEIEFFFKSVDIIKPVTMDELA